MADFNNDSNLGTSIEELNLQRKYNLFKDCANNVHPSKKYTTYGSVLGSFLAVKKMGYFRISKLLLPVLLGSLFDDIAAVTPCRGLLEEYNNAVKQSRRK